MFLYKYEVQFTVIEELLIFKALFWAEDDLLNKWVHVLLTFLHSGYELLEWPFLKLPASLSSKNGKIFRIYWRITYY